MKKADVVQGVRFLLGILGFPDAPCADGSAETATVL